MNHAFCLVKGRVPFTSKGPGSPSGSSAGIWSLPQPAPTCSCRRRSPLPATRGSAHRRHDRGGTPGLRAALAAGDVVLSATLTATGTALLGGVYRAGDALDDLHVVMRSL